MYLANALRSLRRKMDFGFGDFLVPNVGGLRQYFQSDPFGYVILSYIGHCYGLLHVFRLTHSNLSHLSFMYVGQEIESV